MRRPAGGYLGEHAVYPGTVGCGPGTVTSRLAPLFEAAVGLDPDPGMLAYASRRDDA